MERQVTVDGLPLFYSFRLDSPHPENGNKWGNRCKIWCGEAESKDWPGGSKSCFFPQGPTWNWEVEPIAQMVKNLSAMQETRVQFLGVEDPLEKGMAIHAIILAWRIPWTEKPRGLHSSRGHKESDTTEQLTHTHTSLKWKKQSIKESMNCNYSSWFVSTDWRQRHQWGRARGNQRGGSRDLYG